MNSQNFSKSAEVFGAILGGLLISLPAIPQVVAQESTPKVNLCRSIFDERPHNTPVVVPQGCPPNALTQRLTNPNPSIFSEPPYNRSRAPVSPQPGAKPVLEPQQTPIATITLNDGKVNIKLINDTATNVTFQVIGDTAQRSLQGKSDLILQGLTAPVTVTFQREDGGQLIVTPQPSSEPGSLEVSFKEATDAAQARSALRIEPDGSVFLN